jgi:hypothetical protein
VNVDLTEDDLKQIDEVSSSMKLEGARLPEAMLKMTARCRSRHSVAINSNIRVVYCSDFPADALAERNLSLAAGSMLHKPYLRSELIAVVREVLAKSARRAKR